MKFLYSMQQYKTRAIFINGKRFRALLADSMIKRMIGLMFRNGIKENQCMLFTFPSEGYPSIWMYNMKFSIDVVWLDRNLMVVDTKEALSPCSTMMNCRAYFPGSKAKYILEFNQGAIRRNRIKKGSKVLLGIRP